MARVKNVLQRIGLTEEDLTRLSSLVGELLALKFDPGELRSRLLTGLRDIVPAEGTCSVLQLDRFLSDGGKQIGILHQNNPPPAQIKEWNEHIKSQTSEIEKRLFALSKQGKSVGFSCIKELFSPEEWQNEPLRLYAKRVSVGDMAYLWVRCSSSELWVVCLRRKESEEDFTARERQLLEEFGVWFGAQRQYWYLEKLNLLSPSQQKVVQQLLRGRTAKEGSKNLQIKLGTFRKHMENIHQRLNAHNGCEVLVNLILNATKNV